MPKRLAEGMQQLAKANDRPVQQEIRQALREHVERHGRGGASDSEG
jgi:predicted transcriptional regulator